MKIYLAAPLFTVAEQDFNERLGALLYQQGYDVFLPQLESNPSDPLKEIYERNLIGLGNADVVVAVLDGTDVDSGTEWECGYAFARCKPVFGLRTDYRSFSPKETVNLQVQEGLAALLFDGRDLLEALSEYERNPRTTS